MKATQMPATMAAQWTVLRPPPANH
jgi:hypothetical protein